MENRVMNIMTRLSHLGFESSLREKVKLYFEGSLDRNEEVEIQKLIVFVEEVVDERLFKKERFSDRRDCSLR